MMVVAHAAVGGAIGAAVGDPVLGFVGGVASHFVLDAVPHFDAGSFMPPGREVYTPRTYLWAAVDGLGCLVLIAFLAGRSANPITVAAGGLGAIGPDVVFNVPFWKAWTRSLPGLSWLHERIHSGWHWTVPPRDWLAGILTQVITIGGAFWVLGLVR